MLDILKNIQEVNLKSEPGKNELDSDNTLIIGLGIPSEQSKYAAIILNHKGVGRDQIQSESVSQFIMNPNAPVAIWETWWKNINQGKIKIVVEDLSFDTCFALILFSIRVSSTATNFESRIDKWVDYVTLWEAGHYPDVDSSPRSSVACLVSLLGHSYLNSKNCKDGLVACCDFLWSIFTKFEDPRKAVFEPALKDPNYRRAISRYVYEEEQYRLVVRHGIKCQLLVPVWNGDEKILTDAIILDELDPSAILKVFLRNDREYSWTRRGFSLIAMFRSTEQKTGNDMTISVDPDTNLSLDKLWYELEKRENKKWRESKVERPRDDPRKLISYKKFDIPKDDQANQPWYDGRVGNQPCSTLVGAPKGIPKGLQKGEAINGNDNLQSGTMLDWNKDVLPLLWEVFNPIPKIVVDSVTNHSGHSEKNISIVKWEKNIDLTIVDSPTFSAWLAAQSMEKKILSPLGLPDTNNFKVLSLQGGLAIVHREGVTFFDDWTSIKLDEKGLLKTANNIDKRLDELNKFLKHHKPGTSHAKHDAESNSFGAYTKWQEGVTEVKEQLLKVHQSSLEPESFDQANLRNLLVRYWNLEETIKQTEDIIKRYDEVKNEKFQHTLERSRKWMDYIIAGFVTGTTFKEVAEIFKSRYTMNLYEWQIEFARKAASNEDLQKIADNVGNWEIGMILIFLLGFVVGMVLYWKYGAKRGISE